MPRTTSAARNSIFGSAETKVCRDRLSVRSNAAPQIIGKMLLPIATKVIEGDAQPIDQFGEPAGQVDGPAVDIIEGKDAAEESLHALRDLVDLILGQLVPEHDSATLRGLDVAADGLAVDSRIPRDLVNTLRRRPAA